MSKQNLWKFRRERENLLLFLLYHAKQISSSSPMRKCVPDNLKGKSKSSQEWLTRQLNDIYVKKCRYDRYRCRSAYKLLEIDEKYKILKPGFSVIDCGAAPGSWTQVALRKMKLDSADEKKKGLVIAIDLQHIDPLKGAIILKNSDFTDLAVQEEICKLLPTGKADVILSDMAPKATGTRELDSIAIMNLVYSALKFSVKTLKNDGTFLCKVWENKDVDSFFKYLQNLFTSVKRIKPDASRSDSAEMFLLAKGYKCIKYDNKPEGM